MCLLPLLVYLVLLHTLSMRMFLMLLLIFDPFLLPHGSCERAKLLVLLPEL